MSHYRRSPRQGHGRMIGHNVPVRSIIMLSSAIESYRKVKRSNIWRENRAAAFIYPSANIAVKSLRRLVVLARQLRQQARSIKRQTAQFVNDAKKQREQSARDAVKAIRKRAQAAMDQKNWKEA